MRRRNVGKETVEIDVLQKKNEELKQFVERYDSAVAVVTGTINNLKEINENISEKIKEIEEYQTELARTSTISGSPSGTAATIIVNATEKFCAIFWITSKIFPPK